ncbi:glycosyltransferase family 2 protein [Catenulispora subtropica]|uniref:Cellulose synthase (UDP-forming) n=1 Tax=Catenulispora subtropica TaxID=450798 RepID=A0ABN2RZY7_9ACTN
MAPSTTLTATQTPFLPAPPDDDELYWYFGPQRRWVLLCSSLSFIFTAITLFFFSLRTPLLWVFFGVLALNLAGLAFSLADGQKQRRLTRAGHDVLVRAWQPERVPSVDVFLPTCGEPLDVLRNAYEHVARVRWRGALAVYVLDDAANPAVAALAREYGFRYVVRPDRGHLKKAGNLNHALTVADGEVVAILDADFCPRPDFLDHLVPYLADPAVGIVQSPQFFDTDETMSWLQRAAGAAQEWFFRWVQPSRDAADAAICCGSNAVYRRAALDAIGGFAKLDHSEDMYTGLEMLGHGYRTQYVPVLVAKGISPESLPSYVNQQYRWAMGNLHLLTGRDLKRVGAAWRTRVCYYNGVLGYVVMAVNVFAAPLPPLLMLAARPEQIRPWHVLPLLAPLWVWFVLLPAVSRSRWRIEVIRANYLVAFAAGAALLHTLRGRGADWVPTGAGGGRSKLARDIARLAVLWLGATTGAAVAALAADLARFGPARFWGVAVYVAVTVYLTAPLIKDLIPTLGARRAAAPVLKESK